MQASNNANQPDAANDFAAQVFATRSTEDFTVLMKNYIATHYAHQLGSKVLLLNTKDGLDVLAAMVQKKLAERAAAAAPAAAPVNPFAVAASAKAATASRRAA